jgi:hypothetical protein
MMNIFDDIKKEKGKSSSKSKSKSLNKAQDASQNPYDYSDASQAYQT